MPQKISKRSPSSPERQRYQRARSLPYSRPFNVAAIFSGLHYTGLVVAAVALVVMVSDPRPIVRDLFLGAIIFSMISWLVAFFKRRSAHCPLCKGTPLINSGARPHSNAARLGPLNHGVTAILSIIASQRFRCMYCGSDFDLLKTPSRLRSRPDGDDGES